MERLIIKNFGPITDLDIEVGKITVFIGEQATGKSTVAKVIEIFSNTYRFYLDDTSVWLKNVFKSYGLDTFLRNTSYFQYYTKHFEFTAIWSDGFSVQFEPKSEDFKKLINDEIKKPNDFLEESFENYKNSDNSDKTQFRYISIHIPTERGLQSIFSLGKDSISNFSDKLYSYFSRVDKIFKKYATFKLNSFDATYKNESGTSFFNTPNQENYFELSLAASGIKSLIPIELLINFYSIKENIDVHSYSDTKSLARFIIEEPEQNLFPKTQKRLVEFLIQSANQNENCFILPTHSPYILTALENPMYAFSLASKTSDEKLLKQIEALLPRNTWLDPNEVSVYLFEKGGARNILSKENGIIDKDAIDGASDEVNMVFDELIKVELKIEAKNG